MWWNRMLLLSILLEEVSYYYYKIIKWFREFESLGLWIKGNLPVEYIYTLTRQQNCILNVKYLFWSALRSCVSILLVFTEIIDQDALTNALKEKRIFAAGLDVVTPEPISKDHPLVNLPNCCEYLLLPSFIHFLPFAHEWDRRMTWRCGSKFWSNCVTSMEINNSYHLLFWIITLWSCEMIHYDSVNV